ncbi:MAG: DUF4416 family protein [Candidatus Omnitrophica bacterium]|nr:DUF4416 family protein [Candidatus Omnitrophota bacterium]MDD5429731.1 DUF4416 family protein [Candidatus Omnitrophota bacterium]
MLSRRFPLPVKFISGLIYSNEKIYSLVKALLSRRYGKVDFESQPIPFNFTNYYTKEMGPGLTRRFISFSRLRCPADFLKIKLYCLKLEKRFAVNNNRVINIDPGYINEAKLVLLTTKDFSHRVYLDKGIYAEVTLQYRDGSFLEFLTTFPDYRTPQYKEIFSRIRDAYRKDIKKHA